MVVTAKMDRILEIRPEDRLAWVEPGLFNLDLSAALRPTGFTYAPDPSSQQTSSIGGNVNTNAGGPHCLAYGVTSAHVLALDVVMPDGEPSSGWGGGARRRRATTCAGSSWARRERSGSSRAHACGSFRSPRPCARCCSTSRPWRTAPRPSREIIARGVVPAALEMMDQGSSCAAERFAHAGYPTDAAAILIVEVDGSAGAVEAQAARSGRRRTSTRSAPSASRPIETERALMWKGRKSAFGAVAQIAPHYHLHDCVVPRTKLVEVLTGVYAIASATT